LLIVIFFDALVGPAAVVAKFSVFGADKVTAEPSPFKVTVGLVPLWGIVRVSLVLPMGVAGAKTTSIVHVFFNSIV
jgi:hypothetical protein